MNDSLAGGGGVVPAGPGLDEAQAARRGAGVSTVEVFGVVLVTGPDRIPFLETQLPAAITALAPGWGAWTARLDRLGRLRAEVLVAVRDGAVLLLTARDRAAPLAADLDAYHIGEDLEIADATPRLAVVEIHGPRAPDLLFALAGSPLPLETGRSAAFPWEGGEAIFVAHGWTGDPGGHLVLPRGRLEGFAAAAAARLPAGVCEMGEQALEVLRVEGGMPRFGVDVDERTLIQELGRDTEMISYTKGCYLGQETVARVQARGGVHRRLVGVEIEGADAPARGTLLLAGGEPVGDLRSALRSPALDRVIGLAMVRRPADVAGTVLHARTGGALVAALVRELPHWRRPGPREESARLHARGTEAFADGRFEDALAHFQKATLLDPANTAAWEALGITQDRLGRLDEAVATMETLAGQDRENPMAWTNLSRFYARQGRIEDAEVAKGKSLHLAWKREAGEVEARRRTAETDAARRRDLEERIALFEEVVALHADDVVARFGLGKALLDLGRPSEAIPHLQRAVDLQPDYSMAWNHLATCLVEAGRLEEARSVLERGIEAAGRRGDLVPRRAMLARLESIRGRS